MLLWNCDSHDQLLTSMKWSPFLREEFGAQSELMGI
jgi:hypothetical protein